MSDEYAPQSYTTYAPYAPAASAPVLSQPPQCPPALHSHHVQHPHAPSSSNMHLPPSDPYAHMRYGGGLTTLPLPPPTGGVLPPPGGQPFQTAFYNPFEIKHRKRTSRAQFKVLEETFHTNPKPSAILRKELAERLEMTPRGVQIWFQNRRAKAKAQAKKAADAAEVAAEQAAVAANASAASRTSASSSASAPGPGSSTSTLPKGLTGNGSPATSSSTRPSPISTAVGDIAQFPHGASPLPSPTPHSVSSFTLAQRLESTADSSADHQLRVHGHLSPTTLSAGRRGSLPMAHAPGYSASPPVAGLGISVSTPPLLPLPGGPGPVRRASLPNAMLGYLAHRRSNPNLRPPSGRSRLAPCAEETGVLPDPNFSFGSLRPPPTPTEHANSPLRESFGPPSIADSTFYHAQASSLSHAMPPPGGWRDDRRESIASSMYDNTSYDGSLGRRDSLASSIGTGYGAYDGATPSPGSLQVPLFFNPDHRRASCPAEFLNNFNTLGVSPAASSPQPPTPISAYAGVETDPFSRLPPPQQQHPAWESNLQASSAMYDLSAPTSAHSSPHSNATNATPPAIVTSSGGGGGGLDPSQAALLDFANPVGAAQSDPHNKEYTRSPTGGLHGSSAAGYEFPPALSAPPAAQQHTSPQQRPRTQHGRDTSFQPQYYPHPP